MGRVSYLISSVMEQRTAMTGRMRLLLCVCIFRIFLRSSEQKIYTMPSNRQICCHYCCLLNKALKRRDVLVLYQNKHQEEFNDKGS